MANLINTSLGPPLKMFAEHTEKVSNERQLGFEPSDICKELIYQPAYEAVKVAYLVINTQVCNNIKYVKECPKV